MAYAHFGQSHDELLISSKVATDPQELADLVVGSALKAHFLDALKQQRSKNTLRSSASGNNIDVLPNEGIALMPAFSPQTKDDTQTSVGAGPFGSNNEESLHNFDAYDSKDNSALRANLAALDVLHKALLVVESRVHNLRYGSDMENVATKTNGSGSNRTANIADSSTASGGGIELDSPHVSQASSDIIRRFHSIATPSPKIRGGGDGTNRLLLDRSPAMGNKRSISKDSLKESNNRYGSV